uniref:Uncharacterized protein n=1 Tax=Lactuca sativa TaxID=4236 RepID=A0A9R1UQ37_LACSA|nr:hypothetical protein LSAT_V11C800448140 [Lactuca sativa]
MKSCVTKGYIMEDTPYMCQTPPQNPPLLYSFPYSKPLHRLRRLPHEVCGFHICSLNMGVPMFKWKIEVHDKLGILQHPDPTGHGLGTETIVEAASGDPALLTC